MAASIKKWLALQAFYAERKQRHKKRALIALKLKAETTALLKRELRKRA